MATDLKLDVPPPFISSARGLANLRDIGGWPILDPTGTLVGTVRKGIMYRGPDPSPVSPESLVILKDLGITTAYDIRSQQQIDRAGGYKELDGIERIWCPVFGDAEYTHEKATERYLQYSSMNVQDTVDAFMDILTHGAKIAFRQILLKIASYHPPYPSPSLSASTSSLAQGAFLMHCTTGNNRTGVFIGILLSLLSVPRSFIAQEYALSELGLEASRPASLGRLMKNPVFAGEGGKERCERMLGARQESMVALLERVDEKWGGAEGYVRRECGLSEEKVERVREVLTVRSRERN